MSKKNQGNKPKTETPTDVEKVDSSISIVPAEAKEVPSLESAFASVKEAKDTVEAHLLTCDNREISIALTDIKKALTTASRHFNFIDVSLNPKEQD